MNTSKRTTKQVDRPDQPIPHFNYSTRFQPSDTSRNIATHQIRTKEQKHPQRKRTVHVYLETNYKEKSRSTQRANKKKKKKRQRMDVNVYSSITGECTSHIHLSNQSQTQTEKNDGTFGKQ